MSHVGCSDFDLRSHTWTRRLLSEAPVGGKPRACLDLSKGERPHTWAEARHRMDREGIGKA